MSVPEWLQITAEFRAVWERCDRLTAAEWARLDALLGVLQQSRSFQETPQERRRRLTELWAQRETLTIREASQLDHRLRVLLQDIELQDLWSKRDGLSDLEWTRLCQLIHQALSANLGKFGGLLKALPEPPPSYIWDFISRKVFEPCKAPDAAVDTRFHTGTLCVYFRNYLLDCRDQVQRDRRSSQEPPAGQESAELDLFEQLPPKDLHPQWDELTKSMPDVEEVLTEAGLPWEQVSQEARILIDSLEPEDRVLLKCSLCADGVEHIAVDRLKTLMANPAYRAIKLRKRLKRWLAEALGIEPGPENEPVRLAALKILCWRALLDIETDCAAIRARLHTGDAPDTGAAPPA